MLYYNRIFNSDTSKCIHYAFHSLHSVLYKYYSVSDFVPSNHQIACGEGITAPSETRCLYNLDDTGTVIGCRNLAHLQKCGKIRQ